MTQDANTALLYTAGNGRLMLLITVPFPHPETFPHLETFPHPETFPHLETLWNRTVNPNLVNLNEGLVFLIVVGFIRFFLGELLEIFIVLRHLPAPVL